MSDTVLDERTAAKVFHGLDAARRAGWAKFYAERDRADHLETLVERSQDHLRRSPEWGEPSAEPWPEWDDDDPRWEAYIRERHQREWAHETQHRRVLRERLSPPPNRDDVLARIKAIRDSLRAGTATS